VDPCPQLTGPAVPNCRHGGFVALVCFSRLYLGVHYLSDVLAGVAGGGFWLAMSIALLTLYGDRFATRFTDSRLDRITRRITRS
jgi:membrane-associated phospholipid phosphatase